MSASAVGWVGDAVIAGLGYTDSLIGNALTWVGTVSGLLEGAANSTVTNAVAYIGAVGTAFTGWTGAMSAGLTTFADRIITDNTEGGDNNTGGLAYQQGTEGAPPAGGGESNLNNVEGISDGPTWWQEYWAFLNPFSANEPPPVNGWDQVFDKGTDVCLTVGVVAGGAATGGTLYYGASTALPTFTGWATSAAAWFGFGGAAGCPGWNWSCVPRLCEPCGLEWGPRVPRAARPPVLRHLPAGTVVVPAAQVEAGRCVPSAGSGTPTL